MNLGNPQMESLACGLDDFRNAQLEGMRIPFPGTESTELAREQTDVRIVDVPIQDIGRPIPVFSLADHIGDQPESVDIGGPIETRRFLLVDSFGRHDFIADGAQFLRYQPEACEIFHKFNLTQEDSRSKLAASFLIFKA